MRAAARESTASILDLYRAVWRVSARRQLVLIGLSLAVAALAAAPLRFQQLVVNSLIEESRFGYVAWLCAGLLGVVLLSAAFKFALNYASAQTGERVTLLIRERLYINRVAAETADPGGKRGAFVTMLGGEAEFVGGFAGAAIATPVMQLGTLASVIGFIAASQPMLGLLALAVVVPQALIVVLIQARINRRVRERVQLQRDLSDKIAEGDLRRVDAGVRDDFEGVLRIRMRIAGLKLGSKLGLGVISALGVVGVLLLGGWLVLNGRSDVGTVVASLSGLARIERPWRDLISFFRTASTVRVKYGMILPALRSAAS